MKYNGFSIEHLTFAFSKEDRPFFENISFSLEPGKLHFLRGRNGTGKSTLFRLLEGNINHHTEHVEGRYHLDDTSYSFSSNQIASDYKKKVKHIVQQSDQMLLQEMTVQENLTFLTFSSYPSFKKATIPPIHSSLLESAGITLEQKVYTLSGGQKQLLVLFMCTYHTKSILLLDEPTAALDDTNATLVMESLKKIITEKKLIALMICHDTEIVEKYRTGKLLTLHRDTKKAQEQLP